MSSLSKAAEICDNTAPFEPTDIETSLDFLRPSAINTKEVSTAGFKPLTPKK
jgi:hypothetical protein